MVRPKRNVPVTEELVQLVISGPRSLLPAMKVVKVRSTQLWAEVLNDDLLLEISLDKGIFVCNFQYGTSSPVAGKGWRNELTDMVGDYINQLSRKMKSYRVRLCHPFDIAAFKSFKTFEGNNHPITPTQVTSKAPLKRPVTDPRPGPAVMTFSQLRTPQGAAKRARQDSGVESDLRPGVRNPRLFKMEPDSDFEEEDVNTEEDNDSLCTTFEDEMEEFGRDGIEPQDIQIQALRNLSKIQNNVLLRINQEVEKLKEENKWQSNVARAPLTCWLIRELLKPQNL